MKIILKAVLIIVCSAAVLNCSAQKKDTFKPAVVYESRSLIVTRISANSFKHTSFLQTRDFGNVPCNGLIVTGNKEAIIFDTPTNDSCAAELIKWIKEKLHYKINAVIPTHFHDDCLGGLKAFHENNIPSYAYFKTIALAKENNFAIPQHGFTDSLVLKVGNENIIAKFFGEGHTRDNIVGYFPGEHILFGGCMIKETNATKGYLGDANVAEWPSTVEKVKKAFPDVKIVVPGHGEYGNQTLLDYTIQLFKVQ